MHGYLKLLLLLILIVPLQLQALSFSKNKDYTISNPQFLFTAESDFSQIEQDDAWQTFTFYRLPNGPEIFWLRFDVALNEENINGIILSGLFSAEIWWDQRLVGQKGRVSHLPQQEVPGEMDSHFLIPKDLQAKGSHKVYLRISRHRIPWTRTEIVAWRRGEQPFDFFLDDYRTLTQAHFSDAFLPFISLGAFIVIGLYFLLLYLADKKHKQWLIFSILCIAVTGVLISESWRGLFGYPYHLHELRLQIVALFTSATAWLLPAFLFWQHDLKKRTGFLAAWFLLILALDFLIPSYDFSAAVMLLLAMLITAVICVRRYFQLRKFYDLLMGLVSVAGIILLITMQSEFTEKWFFFIFTGYMTSTLMMLAEHNAGLKSSRDQALIERERLRTELMRRHIQPHFVMNTLTSISEWIEEEPGTAIEMIDTLADEFRALSQMLDQTEVTLAKELVLCRAHLVVMSLRQRIEFELETINLDLQATIPPGIFHTLIENAISHNVYRQRIEFILSYHMHDKQHCYRFQAPLGKRKKSSGIGLGTGRKYIESSLSNCYGNNWSIEESEKDDYFTTQIIFGTS